MNPFTVLGPAKGSSVARAAQNEAWLNRKKVARVEACFLLLLATVCLAMLELRVHRRKNGRQRHQANILAEALRRGVLQYDSIFDLPPFPAHVRKERPQNPASAWPTKGPGMMSRYELLAYTTRKKEVEG